ncbi:uncharacterized protein N0V89_009924 [Didymosphaeria variabile]|uniref:Uncharacterized protein n=1 Tax=Didymosphaeria variabile TaxID=1932322 RepID=A0A9W8XEE5_9PLEO|nr:uncharacterized protein N0V89_009924 [Didymosphaeria variabile]KAJ4348547.1 hypothetical protein N0V89_009924 [Didymosphaeria variabile]
MCTKIYTRHRPCPCPTPCLYPLGTLTACRAFLATGRCPQSRAKWSGAYVDVPCKTYKKEKKATLTMRGPRVTGETQDGNGAGPELRAAQDEDDGEDGTPGVEVGDGFGGYSPHASDESIDGDVEGESITGTGEDEDMTEPGDDENTTGTGQDEGADSGSGSEQVEGGGSTGESKKARKTFVDYYWEHSG